MQTESTNQPVTPEDQQQTQSAPEDVAGFSLLIDFPRPLPEPRPVPVPAPEVLPPLPPRFQV